MKNNTGIIIQSRMGSSRFPGKSMAIIDNKSMLQHLLESVLTCFSKSQIWVVTSNQEENIPIVALCDNIGVNCYQGDEENVASRFKHVLEKNREIKFFFRICGDSPFFLPTLIEKAIKVSEQKEHLEIVTSLPNQGHPQGQNIEFIKASTFLKSYKLFTEKEHFAHVTKFLYNNLKDYKHDLIFCNCPGYRYNEFKFSVDLGKDFMFIQKLYKVLNKKINKYSLNELIEISRTIKT